VSAAAASSLARRVAEAADLVTVALDELLPRGEGPEARLTEAMRYAALGPGKRLRTFFALETGKMFDVPERSVLRAACALECIQAYSLIHDDLPCMDDDDLRRGRPTVHKAYDEATAVLAGIFMMTSLSLTYVGSHTAAAPTTVLDRLSQPTSSTPVPASPKPVSPAPASLPPASPAPASPAQ